MKKQSLRQRPVEKMNSLVTGKRILAERLGQTVHQSPLRFKLKRIMREYGHAHLTVEEWLVDLANLRGATVVFRDKSDTCSGNMPGCQLVSNEELAVALCQMNCIDQPQILRLSAQLISGHKVDSSRLLRLAILERATPVLHELARLALRIEPDHVGWLQIKHAFQSEKQLREPLLHWSRLAEPVFDKPPSLKVLGWRLVA